MNILVTIDKKLILVCESINMLVVIDSYLFKLLIGVIRK